MRDHIWFEQVCVLPLGLAGRTFTITFVIYVQYNKYNSCYRSNMTNIISEKHLTFKPPFDNVCPKTLLLPKQLLDHLL